MGKSVSHSQKEQLPQLLFQFNHGLPKHAAELLAFRTSIINLNRIVDHRSPFSFWPDPRSPQACTHWTHEGQTDAFMIQPWEPGQSSSTPPWLEGIASSQTAATFHGATDSSHCEACHDAEAFSFCEDPCFDTDTETDDGDHDKDYEEWTAQLTQNPDHEDYLAQYLLDLYQVAKRRWRRFSGRATRRRRFTRRPRRQRRGQG